MRQLRNSHSVFIILQVCHNTSIVFVNVMCSSLKNKCPYKHFICVQVAPEYGSFSHVLLLMVHCS